MCIHFNIEDGRKKATFSAHNALLFKKGKNAPETHRKRFVQRMEKVLWVFVNVRSDSWSFVLEISHGRVLHGQVDKLKLIVIKSRYSLRAINVYITWETASILKIPRPRAENHLHQLGYVNRFDVWIPQKLTGKKKKNLLKHICKCNSILKRNKFFSVLKTNCDGQWKMYTVQ